MIALTWGSDVDLDELERVVRKYAWESGVHSFLISDTRREFNWGASSSTQEVVISLLSDPAVVQVYAGVAAGAATALTERLIAWARRTREEQAGAAGQPPAPDLSHMISWAKHYVSNAYGIDGDRLEPEEARSLPHGASITLAEPGSGRRFSIETSEDGLLTRIKDLDPKLPSNQSGRGL